MSHSPHSSDPGADRRPALSIADSPPLIEARGLVRHFRRTKPLFGQVAPPVRAVDGVDLSIRRGQTLGLVGESGCGKSTLGRLLVHLDTPDAGEVRFEGQAIGSLGHSAVQVLRQRIQMVFQNPYSALNPRQSIGDTLMEPLEIHRIGDPASRRERALQLLDRVGMRAEHFNRFPHQFSGGQRQRIGIARALALEPALIVCDEPVSALDVSIQSQVLNLLVDLQEQFGLSYLFISHDLRVVEHISDRVAVMYLGRIVEEAPVAEIFARPRHPYTRALLDSVPIPDPARLQADVPLEGGVPDPSSPPSGCSFHPRCRIAVEQCRQALPPLEAVGPGHRVRCWVNGLAIAAEMPVEIDASKRRQSR
jgi:oligopeptide/dipeptide ABC transporter ATP-binding protein